MLIIDAQVHIWGSGKPSAASPADIRLHGGGTDQGDGCGGRKRSGPASAKLGRGLKRNGDRGRHEIPGQILQPGMVSPQ